MKGIITTIIAAATGIGGGFAGYFISKKKEQKRADDEIEEVKKALKEYYEGKRGIKDTPNELPEDKKVVEAKNINYAKQYQTSTPNQDGSPSKIIENDIYMIEAEEYDSEEFDKISVDYYVDDDRFAESDKLMTKADEDAAFGGLREAIVKAFKTENTIYVRNELLKVDYDIMLNYGTFNSGK